MIARRAQTSESFAHVANLMVRGVLESEPAQVTPAKLKQALRQTLDALERDIIDDDPSLYRALPDCIEAAGSADSALLKGRMALCHHALRRFWSI
jgi:hypothetical protein